MTTFSRVIAFSLLSLIGLSAAPAKADVEIDMSRYAAVAYSKSTGKYGYAWDWGSLGAAKRVALSECKAADAEIVGWVQGGWLVLAVADDKAYGTGYVLGDGVNSSTAQLRAVNNCLKTTTSTSPPKIKVVICSGNYPPKVYD